MALWLLRSRPGVAGSTTRSAITGHLFRAAGPRRVTTRPMELRLTVMETRTRTIVRVDGRLSRDSVAELDRVCRGTKPPIVLDLTHLVTVDDTGAATLRRLAGTGVELENCSPYVALLLKGVAAAPPAVASPGGKRTVSPRRSRHPGSRDR